METVVNTSAELAAAVAAGKCVVFALCFINWSTVDAVNVGCSNWFLLLTTILCLLLLLLALS